MVNTLVSSLGSSVSGLEGVKGEPTLAPRPRPHPGSRAEPTPPDTSGRASDLFWETLVASLDSLPHFWEKTSQRRSERLPWDSWS